jgi:hypothetical protein
MPVALHGKRVVGRRRSGRRSRPERHARSCMERARFRGERNVTLAYGGQRSTQLRRAVAPRPRREGTSHGCRSSRPSYSVHPYGGLGRTDRRCSSKAQVPCACATATSTVPGVHQVRVRDRPCDPAPNGPRARWERRNDGGAASDRPGTQRVRPSGASVGRRQASTSSAPP